MLGGGLDLSGLRVHNRPGAVKRRKYQMAKNAENPKMCGVQSGGTLERDIKSSEAHQSGQEKARSATGALIPPNGPLNSKEQTKYTSNN